MNIKSRYDIILGKPGRVVLPPDVSFLSDQKFIEFVQDEIKRREEKDGTVFTKGLTGIGTFAPREQAEAMEKTLQYPAPILGFAGVTGYTGIQGYRGYVF